MEFYSAVLMLSLISCILAILLLAAQFRNKSRQIHLFARGFCIATVLLALSAIAGHAILSHGSGSRNPLGWIDFISNHPAPLFLIFTGVICYFLNSKHRHHG